MTVVKNQALNYLRNEHLRMEARKISWMMNFTNLISVSLLLTLPILTNFSLKK